MGTSNDVLPATVDDVVNQVLLALKDCTAASQLCLDDARRKGQPVAWVAKDLSSALTDFFMTRYGISAIDSAEAWESLGLDKSEREAAYGVARLFGKAVKVSYDRFDPEAATVEILKILAQLSPEELQTNPNKDGLGYARFNMLSTRDQLSLLITRDNQTGKADFLRILTHLVSPKVANLYLKTVGNRPYQEIAHQRFLDLALSYVNTIPIENGSISPPIASVKGEIDKIAGKVVAQFGKPITPGMLESFANSESGQEKLSGFFGDDQITAVDFNRQFTYGGSPRPHLNVVSFALVNEEAVGNGRLHKGMYYVHVPFGASRPSVNVAELLRKAYTAAKQTAAHTKNHPYFRDLLPMWISGRRLRANILERQ